MLRQLLYKASTSDISGCGFVILAPPSSYRADVARDQCIPFSREDQWSAVKSADSCEKNIPLHGFSYHILSNFYSSFSLCALCQCPVRYMSYSNWGCVVNWWLKHFYITSLNESYPRVRMGSGQVFSRVFSPDYVRVKGSSRGYCLMISLYSRKTSFDYANLVTLELAGACPGSCGQTHVQAPNRFGG